MAHALVALGSNLGDRAEQLNAALGELVATRRVRVLIRRSGWFETPPIGGPAGQGAFLNGAALLWTTLAPRPLLAELQQIEEQLGRVRGERWGARVIDLDLLLFDQLVIEHPDSSPGLRPGVDTRTTPLRSAARPLGGAGGCHADDSSRRFDPPASADGVSAVRARAGGRGGALDGPSDEWVDRAGIVRTVVARRRCRGRRGGAIQASASAWIERLQQRFASGPRIVAWDDYRSRSQSQRIPTAEADSRFLASD